MKTNVSSITHTSLRKAPLFTLAISVISGSFMFWSSQAEARRYGDREGFNFGTSFRILDGIENSESKGTSNNTQTSDTKSSTQAFSPHIAWAFEDTFNFGLSTYFEQSKSQTLEKEPVSGRESTREQSTAVTGAGIFGRLLFARVMFFELGVGIYDQRVSSSTETKNAQGNSFTGDRTSHSVHGVGPGYHAGGGLELPIADGFYFSGSYLVRYYQLRDYNNKSDTIGPQTATQQRKELAFGLAYYYQ